MPSIEQRTCPRCGYWGMYWPPLPQLPATFRCTAPTCQLVLVGPEALESTQPGP